MENDQSLKIDHTGSLLVCKRPGIDLDAWQAEKTNTVTEKCSACQTPVFVMRKNLGRGLLLLCPPCAAEKLAAMNESVVFLGGEVIGSKEEGAIIQAAAELETKMRRDNPDAQ